MARGQHDDGLNASPEALRRPAPHLHAVVAIQAARGPDPQETGGILGQAEDRGRSEAVLHTEVTDQPLLGRGNGRREQGEEKRQRRNPGKASR